MPMVTAAAIMGGSSLLGGLLGGSSAKRAAQIQADAMRDAAKIAADEARFRPVGVTTRFGQSQFQYGPDGRVSGAGYELSPDLRALQDRLFGLAGGGLTDAEMSRTQLQPLTGAGTSLFNLGQKYLAETPDEVAAKYMRSQQDLLAPGRERQYAQLQNQLFQTGRGGLSVGATGMRPGGGAGLGATNPELEAYYNAIAQQDAQLAAGAQEAGQRQLAFGTGLFGTGAQMYDLYGRGQVGALAPYQAYMGGVTGLEALGQQPLDIGINIGAKGMSPSAANSILQGYTGAADAEYKANAYNPFTTALTGFASNPAIARATGNALFGPDGMFSPQVNLNSPNYAGYSLNQLGTLPM